MIYFVISIGLLLVCYLIDNNAELKLTDDELAAVATACILWPVVIVIVLCLVGLIFANGIAKNLLSICKRS